MHAIRRHYILFLLAGLLIFGVASIMVRNQTATKNAQNPTSTAEENHEEYQEPAVEVSGEKEIDIKGGKFVPEGAIVKLGTKIVWHNEDPETHKIVADDESWSIESIAKSEYQYKVFEKAGTYPYHSESNPEIKGTIVVEE